MIDDILMDGGCPWQSHSRTTEASMESSGEGRTRETTRIEPRLTNSCWLPDRRRRPAPRPFRRRLLSSSSTRQRLTKELPHRFVLSLVMNRCGRWLFWLLSRFRCLSEVLTESKGEQALPLGEHLQSRGQALFFIWRFAGWSWPCRLVRYLLRWAEHRDVRPGKDSEPPWSATRTDRGTPALCPGPGQ